VRVALLFGGRSGEHAISVVTAAGVMRALDPARYEVIPIGITHAGQWVLSTGDPEQWQLTAGDMPEVVAESEATIVPSLTIGDGRLRLLEPGQVPRALSEVDVVFPLLHGPFGEDGTVQGLLELADVRYVGSGVLASALGMDKHFCKIALQAHGIPVAPYTVIRDRDWTLDRKGCLDAASALDLPLFVKPARSGSSLGVTRVDDLSALPAAIEAAREHDLKVLVEAGVDGREIECAVLGGRDGGLTRASLPGEIVVDSTAHAFYDFEAKYLSADAAQLTCPADLPDDVVARVQNMAVRTFDALECEGLARVDVFVTSDERVIVNEINTMPGFTPISMFPRMWAETGLTYPDLLDDLIHQALSRSTGLR